MNVKRYRLQIWVTSVVHSTEIRLLNKYTNYLLTRRRSASSHDATLDSQD